jgi:bacteriocin-like protein
VRLYLLITEIFRIFAPVCLTLKFNTIMKQNEKNSQKAQELTKEELEQVNGGTVTIDDILKSTTAILMFP